MVEKILADGEPLPAAWPVAGTTGYDALRHVDGLFTDPAGAGNSSASTGGSRPPGRSGRQLGGDGAPGGVQGDHARAGHGVRPPHARGEPAVRRLPDPEPRDHAPWALGTALRELLVRVEVYRPYPSTDASSS